MERRQVLLGSGATISVGITGCLDGVLGAGDDTPPPASGTFEYETQNIGDEPGLSSSMVYESVGGIDIFTAAERAFEELPFDDPQWSERDVAETFIEETAFDQEFLIYVISSWPRHNHTEIEFRDVQVTGATVTGTVRAIGDDAEEGDATPKSPAGLIRASVGGNWPDAVEFTVIDGHGYQEGVRLDWGETQ
ncbi:hypothetical protein [Natranaeroarchaeum sulfidigenes]|uniref:Lipoprotein n=1 Tax=Natranaeroarchaeum sulfidigenes TaxID=2784880 RepID=A0A897MTN1_9EURY|nr:hypothetical protein [Natranaeroarchaeum sulfidigenes]QSG02309.1 Uncharacterized protein AArcS_1089 [Natranaeroarchaeum sulfidigenes]